MHRLAVQNKPDIMFTLACFALVAFGFLMVYSSSGPLAASQFQDSFYYVKKQIVHGLVGISAFFFFSRLPYSHYRKYLPLLYGGTFFLLVLTLIPGIGLKVGGARRWLDFYITKFQPSELAKIVIILYAAHYMDRKKKQCDSFKKGLAPYMAVLGAMLLLILAQPDFGTTTLLSVTLLLLMLLGPFNKKHLMALGILGLFMGALLILLFPYRLTRLVTFSNPWGDPANKGFQLIQSVLSYHVGGVWGQGLGNGQEKLFFLPAAHTDFILSLIAEELGFAGILTIIVLYIILVWRGLEIAHRCEDQFGSYLAYGLTFLLGFQAMINMSVTMGLLPTKGITLPLVSYGGSSLIFTLIMCGVIVNISLYSKQKGNKV